MVPAASGWRAIASIAAATERPSASAGPIEPIETAMTAPMMAMSFGVHGTSFILLSTSPSGGADEDGGEDGEDVGLHKADQDFEDHERDRHEQPGQSHDQGDDEFAAHDVAEEAHHEREGPRHLGEDVERQHDELRLGEAGEIAAQGPARARRSNAPRRTR